MITFNPSLQFTIELKGKMMFKRALFYVILVGLMCLLGYHLILYVVKTDELQTYKTPVTKEESTKPYPLTLPPAEYNDISDPGI